MSFRPMSADCFKGKSVPEEITQSVHGQGFPVTINELLSYFDGVRPRGAGKWSARCPAHQDNSPSLSIAEGDKGLLIHCFALCNNPDIVEAVGLTMADLFFDALDTNPSRRREAAQDRERKRERRERQREQQGTLIDALREADTFIQSRRGFDISPWSHDRLTDELNALADAYHLFEREGLDG